MEETGKLGIWRLTAIVFGSVIGASIFNIAQNMAHGAAAGAVMIAWALTGLGILFLVLTFQRLSKQHPELRAGIYQYAQVGFGNFVGFNMAWGYWLCVVLGNVTYAVLLNDSVGAFIPIFNGHGWPTFLLGTALIWFMYFLVTRGFQSASYINTIMSVLKFACIVLILGILAIYFRIGLFTSDFWGTLTLPGIPVESQIESCMLVTIWSFLGIEGAVNMSARAKRHSDVGKATMTGFLLALVLYILVTVLCFGIMSQPEIAALKNPSLAYVLEYCVGSWAKWFVVVAIIISVSGGFVAWSLLCAQTPYEAAVERVFPSTFLLLNRHGVPAYGMRVASVVMTLCLLLVITAENVYLAAVNLASMMILPCYFFCGLYLLKTSMLGNKVHPRKTNATVFIAGATVIYCAYSMYAGSLWLLMLTSIFYLAGVPFMLLARREDRHRLPLGSEESRLPLLLPKEKVFLAILILFAAVSVWLLATGRLALDN